MIACFKLAFCSNYGLYQLQKETTVHNSTESKFCLQNFGGILIILSISVGFGQKIEQNFNVVVVHPTLGTSVVVFDAKQ